MRDLIYNGGIPYIQIFASSLQQSSKHYFNLHFAARKVDFYVILKVEG